MSIPTRITIGFLVTQVALFLIGLSASGIFEGFTSYHLYAFGGITSSILVMIGALAAPFVIFIGLIGKKATLTRSGFALLIINTIPLIMILVIGEILFGDQYEVLRADGTLRTKTVEEAPAGDGPNE